MKLQELLDQLDEFDRPLTLDDLRGLLGQLEIDFSDICDCVQFCDDRYERNLVRRTANYEALLLCFEPGQRTPIHDHAGSACGVRVIEGQGIETIFESTEDGWLFATGSSVLPAGGVVGSVDMDIHQLSNLQPGGKRLVTLHIYSPPLGKVGNYRIEDNTVTWVTAATRDASMAHLA
jgi:cysteine dioxygenase